MDTLISKPIQLRGYALHRLVAQHQNGMPALWRDEGDVVRIRPCDACPPTYAAEQLLGFVTLACVSFGRKHRYLPLTDWRGRKAWLEAQGSKYGFKVVGVHVEGGMQSVTTHDGRNFTIDATQFSGLLRVTNPAQFTVGLLKGIGKVGKAFGLNLLVVH